MAAPATRDAARSPRLAAAHHAWSYLEDGLNLIAASAISALMFIGVFQIVSRTVFGVAIYGYIDYMEQASALFAFLGIAYAQRVGAHIRMDLLLRGVSLRCLWAMELFAVTIALVIVSLLIVSSYENFLRASHRTDLAHGVADPADRAHPQRRRARA